MIVLNSTDALHKSYLLRTLNEILDSPLLSQNIYFKGGTCAAMMGLLDRFSVDLDFDLKEGVDEVVLRKEFHKIFKKLGFEIDQESKKALEFFLKYKNEPNKRNTLKIDALNFVVKANNYEPVFLAELNRTVVCQTKNTIFANKMVAVLDRYNRNNSIAGRDIYDIHYFFQTGLGYNSKVIEERTGKPALDYLIELKGFIKNNITQTIVDQDLNTLLEKRIFAKIRKTLITETLMFLDNEINRLSLKKTT